MRMTWLLAYPFRLFFTLGALWAIVAVLVWLLMMSEAAPPTLSLIPMHWHSHEMVHGFTSAMIAGFLLTAMSNWTGIPAISGRALAALGLLWLAGRLVMVLTGVLPGILVVAVPPLFYLAVAALATRDLIKARNRRNLIMPCVLVVLALGSGLMIAGALNMNWAQVTLGTHLSLYTLTLLMAVIAGRITPAFTTNWLRTRGLPHEDIKRFPLLEKASLIALVLLALLDILALMDTAVVAVALAAGALHLLRLWFWRGWRVTGEPLLWILHLGYFCLALSLVARGLITAADYSLSLWYHLLGLGAMGILIIGVMTRVSLGHTGRPLRLPVVGFMAYLGVTAALVARLLSFGWPELGYQGLLVITGGLWMAGFGAFLWGFLPILTAPRPDGRAG